MDNSDNTFIVIIRCHAPRVRLKMKVKKCFACLPRERVLTFKCMAPPLKITR